MSSLSSAEREAVREFIEFGTDTFGFDTGRALPLALVLLGERDGCLISCTEASEAEFVESCLSDADIPYLRDDAGNLRRFFVAKSERHLRSNSVGEGRPDGKFFGYPDDSIEFYCSSSDPVGEFEEFMRDSQYDFDSWGDKTPLIEYIPAPSASSIEEALEREERYERALKSCSVDFSAVMQYRF